MSSSKDRRTWPRRLVWAALFLLLLSIVPGWLLYHEAELRDLMAQIDRADPGWRFEDLESARGTMPDSENGALLVLQADQKIPIKWLVVPSSGAPGLVERLAEVPPDARLPERLVAEVKAALEQTSEALPLALRLANRQAALNEGEDSYSLIGCYPRIHQAVTDRHREMVVRSEQANRCDRPKAPAK